MVWKKMVLLIAVTMLGIVPANAALADDAGAASVIIAEAEDESCFVGESAETAEITETIWSDADGSEVQILSIDEDQEAEAIDNDSDSTSATKGTCGASLTWSFNSTTGTLTISGSGKMYDYDPSESLPPWDGFRDSIRTIVIKDGVTSIGGAAFFNYYALETVTLPDGLSSIGDAAFYLCVRLKKIDIPDEVTHIGNSAFYYCSSLTEITIPESMTEISAYAFWRCFAVTKVTIPGGVKSIGMGAFAGCDAIKDVYYDGLKSEWSAIKIGEENTYLTSAAIHYNQTLTVSAASTAFNVGETAQITASGKGTITYSSGNTSVATVDSNGLITGVKPGTAVITVKAAGDTNYNAASKTLTVTITLATGKISSLTNTSSGIKIKWSRVSGATGYYVYRKTSSAEKYTRIKTISDGSTVSYTDTKVKSKNGKTYLYKVVPYSAEGKGTGKAKTTVRLTAVKLSGVSNSASKKITVKWEKTTKVTGYQIQYSTSKTFESGNKTVKVSSAKKESKVISKLTKKKTYYVRIRTYKTVNGKTYYSAWSSKLSVKITK